MPVTEKLNQEQGLRHQLSAGQMAMVAVGGSIGTGLLLGSAAALEIAGPGVILSFALAAFINWTVAMALGELSSVHPAAGSFGLYGDIYLNQWAGFIARAGYWAAIAVSIGAELVASATYMGYWFPAVPALIWVVGFSTVLLLVNLRSVRNYGRNAIGKGDPSRHSSDLCHTHARVPGSDHRSSWSDAMEPGRRYRKSVRN